MDLSKPPQAAPERMQYSNKMATKVGPQDYDPAYIGKRVPNALIKETITPEPAIGSVKN